MVKFFAATNESTGALTISLRGYIQGNTESVFKTNYQARHVEKNLMEIAFGSHVAQDDKELFHLLQNASLGSDDKAPIYPTV